MTNTVINNVDVITVSVPTGITYGEINVTGRTNPQAGVGAGQFNPIAVITGVSGLGSSNEIATGSTFVVTGINAFYTGKPYFNVGISGTGNAIGAPQVHFYNTMVSGSSTGVGLGSDSFYQSMNVDVTEGFIGTGRLFLENAWDTGVMLNPFEAFYTNSQSYGYAINQMDFFSDEIVVEGTRVNVTGYGPSRGVTGSNVEISGEGFGSITGVGFEVSGLGDTSCYYADFTIHSNNNKITATVPSIAVKGQTNVVLSGGTNDIVGPFEVVLDASVVEFEINSEGAIPKSSNNLTTFTIEETVNGVIFLVTKNRFPDGTTVVVSSVPKP